MEKKTPPPVPRRASPPRPPLPIRAASRKAGPPPIPSAARFATLTDAELADEPEVSEVRSREADELVEGARRGEPRAFEALYDRYKDYVYRVAYMTLRNSDDAEEATQEAFMDVLRGLKSYDVDGAARFETWVYRVTGGA